MPEPVRNRAATAKKGAKRVSAVPGGKRPAGATAPAARVVRPATAVPAAVAEEAPASSNIARRRAAAKDESSPAYLERRREIVAAAARVFKDKGLQGTRLGDIAAESGADRASLYYYVGSKEELFQEVVRDVAQANLATAEHIRDGDGTVQEKLRGLIESLMTSYGEHYPILYVYIQENLKHVPDKHAAWADDMRRVNRAYERLFIDLIQEGVAEGSIRDVGPAWVVAYGIIGMLGWTNRWFNPEDSQVTAAEIAEAFADTVLLGLVEPRSSRRRRSA